MDLHQLKKLVEKGESQNVEFKKKAAHPDKIVKEIVAFANSDGGWLLLGVDDNGTLSGLKFPEEEENILTTAIRNFCFPQIKFNTQLISLNHKKGVVAYEIPTSHRKPHKVKAQTGNLCYVRIKDRSVKASREMQEIIRRKRSPRDMNVKYEEKEQVLMQYLHEKEFITLSTFQNIASLSRKQASRTLVHLVLANILDIEPDEKADRYSLHASFNVI